MSTPTEQDVCDAFYAYQTQRLARTEQCAPEAIVRADANTRQHRQAVRDLLARGQQLLKHYRVVMSDRSVIIRAVAELWRREIGEADRDVLAELDEMKGRLSALEEK
jgi:hypothetical protein